MPIDLSALNPEQYEATMCTDGPLLLLAGAGTGKTRVLTYRIAHMVEDLHVSPYQILAVTFTNKAATEMRVRLAGLVPGGIRGMWVSTFHAACVRMLRQNAEAIGYTRNFTIYDDDDSKRLMREIYATLNISPKQYAPNALRSRISSAKNDLEEPSELAELAENAYDRVAARAYAALQDRLRRADAMDFDDLLFNAVRLLRDNKHVLNDYQERFRYILIDEYQDTNKAQYAISNMLASKYRNIMVVGDDDQSIYSWRGADIRNILEFENDYPDATVLKLERNYRSTATILNAANAVVSHNAQRKDKHLFTDGDKGNKIAVYQASDERDEGRWIAGEIEKLHRRGRSYADIAVFYRTNAQSRVLEDMMLRAGVPYRIVGGTRFFDRAEIRDVMAYLKIIVNPADDVSAKRVVNTPRRGIGKTTIEKLEGITRRDECTFLEACELAIADAELIAQGARNSLAKFVQMIKDARQFDGQLRDVVELIVERSGLIEALKAEHSEEAEGRIENIQEFYGVVQEYDETHEDVFEDDSIDAISETTANAQLPLFMEWLALRTDLDSL
ncbi:MAG: UvrD-helicase domain-containing protein, partial [Coriobacteriales bacterium]|nr:UvrD-helicase domain-containing protein [Coriobacteriales bacterium]